MPLPLTVSCFSKIQIGFTFLVPAHLGSPGQRAVKRVCVSLFLMPSCLMTLNECFMFNALMLWHYWLGVRKGIWTCVYSPADATATHCLFFCKIQVGCVCLFLLFLLLISFRYNDWAKYCSIFSRKYILNIHTHTAFGLGLPNIVGGIKNPDHRLEWQQLFLILRVLQSL